MALMRLSELFNHSSPRITKIYLGIREKELLETYEFYFIVNYHFVESYLNYFGSLSKKLFIFVSLYCLKGF